MIGIYADAPPEECAEVIRSVRVANYGAVPLLQGMTRLRDYLADAALDLLTP